VIPTNNDSIWHRFQDIATFTVTVYVTGCDLEKYFVFEKKVEIKATCVFLFLPVYKI